MKVYFFLILASNLNSFAYSMESCENAGGRCELSKNTHDCSVLKHAKCSGASHICCRTDLTRNDSARWTCEKSKKCLKKRGECIPKNLISMCPASTHKRKHLCASSSCVCCIEKKNNCQASPKCLAKKGFCFRKGKRDECTNGRAVKKLCVGKKCACCLPAPAKCSPLPKCKALNGFCIPKKSKYTCKGFLIKKACQEKQCRCCIPDEPTPPATTTTTTVTTTSFITTTTTLPNTCRCGIVNDQRVVGGVQVEPQNKYPWLVGLDVLGDSKYDCAGNIIADIYILTAAHCLFNPNTLERIPLSNITVGIADHNQNSMDDDVPGVTRRLNVQDAIIFPDYSVVNVDFDIALLKLEEPLDFTKREIGPICLPEDDSQTYGGIEGTVVGWGITAEDGEQPDIVREVNIPILEKNACEMIMVNFFTITETMICAGTAEGGIDACEGDSGGPLSVVEDEQHVVVGIAAFGDGCARPNIPGVYSRVSKFLDWIRENTQDGMFCS